jgi:Cell division protein
MIEKLRYFIKEGMRSIWVNRMMSFASVLVLCVCLVMLGTTFLTTFNISNFITELESKNQIMVYLQKTVGPAGVGSIEKQIKATPNVESYVFLTQEQNFELSKKTLGEQKILLQGIDSTAFPASFQVKLVDLTKYAQTVAAFEKIQGVDYVSRDQGLASIMTNIQKVVSIAGFWLFVILAVISLFIISNTIKLALFSRKREINIMKFVGATDWFIRWPFIVEGLIIGLISAVIALIAQYYIYTGLVEGIIRMINVTEPISYGGQLYIILPGFLLGGVLVGALGSVMSVRRYLRV